MDMERSVVVKGVQGPLADSLHRDFTNLFRKGYVLANDSVMPEYFQDFAQDIKRFRVRSSDNWVCSFPKTGATIYCSPLQIRALKHYFDSKQFIF
jgi:hypothetical protein